MKNKIDLFRGHCKRLWNRYGYEAAEMVGTIIISIIVSAIVSFATLFLLSVLLPR